MVGKKIIVAGHICLEVTPDPSSVPEESYESLFQPGQAIPSEGVKLAVTGSVPNTALALHQLGVLVSLIGKIGYDEYGRVIQDILRQESPHLVADLVIDPGTPTGHKITQKLPGEDPSQLYSAGANDTFYASDLPRVILDTADIFHFSDPTLMRSIYRGDGAELVSILLRARRAGATTSVELSLPDPTSPAREIDWHLILANSLPLADLVVSDAAALLFMLKPETYDRMWEDAPASFLDNITPELLQELSEMVLGYGVKAVMINLGQRGNYLRTNSPAVWQKGGRGLAELSEKWYHRELWAPAFEIDAQETAGGSTGAIAGFLFSIVKGADPETALVMASAVGSCRVKSAGDKGGLSTWEETLARVTQGWGQLPLNPGKQGWREEGQYGLWDRA